MDLASGGRAYLGLVAGAWLDRLGLDGRAPVARMREAVEIVRRLFAGDRSGFAGSHFSLAPGAGFEYEPARKRIPLMIGTWRPRMAALAGEVAEEVKIGGCANPKMVELMRSWIGSDDVGIVVGAVTVVDENGDAARERALRGQRHSVREHRGVRQELRFQSGQNSRLGLSIHRHQHA